MNLDKKIKTNWGVYTDDQFLESKYQLEKHGIYSQDPFFKRGLIYSSIKGETIKFKATNLSDYLAIRSQSATDSAGIKIIISDQEVDLKNKDRFKWNIIGPIPRGDAQNILIINNGGFSAVNVMMLLTNQDLALAKTKSQQLLDKFEIKDLNTKFGLSMSNISYSGDNPTSYNIEDTQGKWIIFTDHYSPNWSIGNIKALPMYSMVNGFWMDQKSNVPLHLKYDPQDNVDLGIKISVATLLIILAISSLIFKSGYKSSKK